MSEFINEEQFIERVIKVERDTERNTKDIEKIVGDINGLSEKMCIAVQQIESIAGNLKLTSENLKEIIQTSNTLNAKDYKILQERINKLEEDYTALSTKINKETVQKDADTWRDIKKQILAWIVAGILGIVALYLGFKK